MARRVGYRELNTCFENGTVNNVPKRAQLV
jgi:hypothetical protein